MSYENIYQFINEYNNEIRASYNSRIDIINNNLANFENNYFNNIEDLNSQINSIYNNSYPYINILISNYTYAYNNNRQRQENPVFSSDAIYIGKECSICLEQVDSIETMAATNCSSGTHVFHKNCINNWLLRSNSCPNCRSHL